MGRRAANRRNKGGSAERKEDDASAVTKFDVAWAPLFPPRHVQLWRAHQAFAVVPVRRVAKLTTV